MKLKTVLKWLLDNWLELIAAIALAGACTLTFVNVIIRYCFPRFVLIGAEELTTLFISWTVFVGAAVACKHKMLFGIDVLVNLLPKSVQKGIAQVVRVLVLVTAVVGAWLGWVFAGNAWVRTTSNLGIPYFFMDIPICICFAMIAYYTAAEMIGDLRRLLSRRRDPDPL